MLTSGKSCPSYVLLLRNKISRETLNGWACAYFAFHSQFPPNNVFLTYFIHGTTDTQSHSTYFEKIHLVTYLKSIIGIAVETSPGQRQAWIGQQLSYRTDKKSKIYAIFYGLARQSLYYPQRSLTSS